MDFFGKVQADGKSAKVLLVSNIYRMRWRIILLAIGLLLFAAETYDSYRQWQIQSSPGRYFWWSFIRLDSDPVNRHPRPAHAGVADGENSADWDLPDKIVDPGYVANSSFFSGLPAFLVSMLVIAALSRLGISQVWTFMIATPILLFAWYYFLGWLLDRRRPKRGAVNT